MTPVHPPSLLYSHFILNVIVPVDAVLRLYAGVDPEGDVPTYPEESVATPTDKVPLTFSTAQAYNLLSVVESPVHESAT